MNPLFNQFFGQKQAHTPLPQQQVANPPQNNMNVSMDQLRANPAQTIRNAGYQVPDEISGNPQATVMHLIQTGQVGGPMMQRIRPMLQMMGIK